MTTENNSKFIKVSKDYWVNPHFVTHIEKTIKRDNSNCIDISLITGRIYSGHDLHSSSHGGNMKSTTCDPEVISKFISFQDFK